MATRSSGRGNVRLGESWVIEGDVSNSDTDDLVYEGNGLAAQGARRAAQRRRKTKAEASSAEPELVMPSLDANTTMGSSSAADRGHEHMSRSPASRRETEDGPKRRGARSTTAKRTSRPGTSPKFREHPQRASTATYDLFYSTMRAVGSIVSYVGGLFGESLWILRSVLAYVLALLILLGMVWLLRTLAVRALYNAISPVCVVPGASFLLPFCSSSGRSPSASSPSTPLEFDRLMEVQSNFEDVLKETAGGQSLPLDMKRGEASIRDLRQLVRYSSLHSK